jgi:hypothetical protein
MTLVDRIKQVLEYIKAEQAAQDAAIEEIASAVAGGGGSLTWTDLVSRWDAEPTLVGTAATPAAGDVYAYNLGGATRYRLVPAPYGPAADVFYNEFSAGACSGPIVARNQ